jgi:hypothetical protein
MSSLARRKERYRTDPEYRAKILARSRSRKEREREAGKRFEWHPMDTAPRNEVIKLYDPAIFWPVLGSWENGKWIGVHFHGQINPTHWALMDKVPHR